MKPEFFSYRYAQEILQHKNYRRAWKEIDGVVRDAPFFVFPNKSANNSKLDVVQQVLNTYFDRRFAQDLGWEYHPLATSIASSGLKADFRKKFADLPIQAEVQFGNMARWYSDIFKFQTAYSQNLAQLGLSIIPMHDLAVRINSNVVNLERTKREISSALLSITLPILIIGLIEDERTKVVDIGQCRFKGIKDITGKGNDQNKWRIVNGYLKGVPMDQIGPDSDTGPMLGPDEPNTDD